MSLERWMVGMGVTWPLTPFHQSQSKSFRALETAKAGQKEENDGRSIGRQSKNTNPISPSALHPRMEADMAIYFVPDWMAAMEVAGVASRNNTNTLMALQCRAYIHVLMHWLFNKWEFLMSWPQAHSQPATTSKNVHVISSLTNDNF